jgi:hypothetical protein
VAVYRCCKSRSRCCTCCNDYTRMFEVYVPNVSSSPDECCKCLSGCCKSISRCCIYMHIASIYFKCFKMFYTYACKCFIWTLYMFAMIFNCFSGVFRKCFRHLFQVFHLSFFVYCNVTSGCFKNRLGVAHVMCVGSDRQQGRRPGWHGRCPEWYGPTAGAELDAVGASSLPVQAMFGHLRPDQTFGR